MPSSARIIIADTSCLIALSKIDLLHIVQQLFEKVSVTPEVQKEYHQKYPKTTWLELKLIEGKNRQVRRMTAAVGHPTLRLVRVAIEELSLFPLKSGEITQVSGSVLMRKLHLG